MVRITKVSDLNKVDLNSVTSLYLNDSKIKRIPSKIFNAPNVTEIYIDGHVNTIPKNIGKLKKLKKLTLSGGYMESEDISESLRDLHDLKELRLTNKTLHTIPDFIGNIKSLEILGLRHNRLTELPDTIENLTNLREILLGFNMFDKMPDQLRNLKKLEVIDMASNRLTEIPDWIGELNNLKELDLSLNHIESLPESIGSLSKLEKLDLDANRVLKNIPKSITKLRNLKVLEISNNSITELPENFGRLSNLERLDISGNPIKKLPNDIGKLRKLKNLDVSNTNLKTLCPLTGVQIKNMEKDYRGISKFKFVNIDLDPEELDLVFECDKGNETACKAFDHYCGSKK